MKIRQKGIVLVAIPLAFLAAVLASEIWLVESEEQLFLNETRSKRITALSADIATRMVNCRAAIALFSETGEKSLLTPIGRTTKTLTDDLSHLESLAKNDPLEASYVLSLSDLCRKFMAECTACWQEQIDGQLNTPRFLSMKEEMTLLTRQIGEKVEAIRMRELYLTGGKPDELVAFRAKFQALIFAAAVIGLLLAVGLALFFTRQIGSRLKILSENAAKMASDQELSEPLAGSDEITVVDQAFRQARQSIVAATATLKEEETRLRTLINGIPTGVLLTTADHKVGFVNDTALRLMNCSATEIIGREILSVLESLPPAGDLSVHETSLRTNAEKIPVEVRVEQLNLLSNSAQLIAFSDIRQRKKIETMRQQFISMLTHDLRSPLTSISLVLQMLAYGAHGELEAEATKSVEEAKRTTDRLLRLVADLLMYDKITVGGLELNSRPTSLLSIIEETLIELRPLAEKAQINLELEACAEDGAAFEVLADRDRIGQVTVNLINNAIKFSPPGSTITVKANRVENDLIKTEVIDHGRGIAPEQIDHIFDQYKQVEIDDAGRGSGLGLAICKAIVQAHGGTMGVESSVGEGSKFWFSLPTRISAEIQSVTSL